MRPPLRASEPVVRLAGLPRLIYQAGRGCGGGGAPVRPCTDVPPAEALARFSALIFKALPTGDARLRRLASVSWRSVAVLARSPAADS